MKLFKTQILGLALTGLILGACSQTGTYETADLMNEQSAADKAGFKMTPFGTGNANAYVVDEYFSYSSESNTICYDEEGEFTVSFYAQNPLIECGNFQIQYRLVGGDWLDLTETSPNYGVVTATLTGLAIGEYEFRAQWLRTGSQSSCPSSLGDNTGWQVATDNLIVVECPECDEAAFDYSTSNNQNITFTYNHGEEVESLTLAFTFPQVLGLPLNENGDYVAPDGKIYSVNNPTNQTVFTWTGDVSCKETEAETFVFAMAADCSAQPANDGQAIIWTDTKIVAINGVALVDDLETLDINEGPYSLKGDLANIVNTTSCPVN